MADYIKFRLTSGQQAPEGSTSVGITNDWIVWYGEESEFPGEITHELMTTDEIEEYLYYLDLPNIRAAALNEINISVFLEKSYTDVENYIENNVNDLAGAKEFLKKLSKLVLAILKYNAMLR